MGEEEAGEVAGQQETADSFEHLQPVGWGGLCDAHISSKLTRKDFEVSKKAKSQSQVDKKRESKSRKSSEYQHQD